MLRKGKEPWRQVKREEVRDEEKRRRELRKGQREEGNQRSEQGKRWRVSRKGNI